MECIEPCLKCSGIPTNCTSCTTGFLFNNSCTTSCPESYYLVGQVCLACATNCLTCSSITNCSICSLSANLLNGQCLSECPASIPIVVNRTCQACIEDCLTCSVATDNCTSCPVPKYLYRYICVSTCPIGTVTDTVTSTCSTASFYIVVVYFPFFITFITIAIAILISKAFNPSTAVFPTIVAVGSILELGSWLYYLTNLTKDEEISTKIPLALMATALGVWLILDIAFYVVIGLRAKSDDYFKLWIGTTSGNYWAYIIVLHSSLLASFRFYRLLYCRLFDLQSLSMMFKNSKLIFPITTLFSLLVIILSEVLTAASAIQVVYYKNRKDELFYSSTEVIVLTACMAILTLLDMHKS